MTLKTILGLTTVGFSLILGATQVDAAQVVLYDGSLNSLPAAQGKLIPGAIQSNGFPTSVSQSLVTGGVQVVTNANSAEYSGYSNYNPVTSSFVGGAGTTYILNQNPGYSIFFNVSLDSTTTNSNDRAAFSIIAIGAGNQGIELGFESNLIFAQNSTFTRGEVSSTINTTQSINYELRVIGSQYFLLANNSQILTGSLRSYSFDPINSNPPLGTFNPYTTPNFIFFGDNTGQESGTFTLRSVSFDTIPFEFSPGLGLLILGTGLGLKRLKRKLRT